MQIFFRFSAYEVMSCIQENILISSDSAYKEALLKCNNGLYGKICSE